MTSARDRAIEAVLVARCENVTEPDGTPCPGRLRYHWGQSGAACDTCGGRCGIAVANWERVEPDGLRALAGEAAAPAEQREEWAAWEDTHTDDPNDEAARARPLTDRADAEDYVLMPKARRRRIARRTVTRSRWVAVDAAPETTEETR